MFCEDVRRSSEYTSISFGETIQSLMLNNTISTIPENGNAYSLLPRKTVGGRVNNAPVKIKSTSNEARFGRSTANQQAAVRVPKVAVKNPVVEPQVIPESEPSTSLHNTKEPLLHLQDIDMQELKSTECCMHKAAPQGKLSSNSKPAQVIPKGSEQAEGTNSTCKRQDLETLAEPVPNLCHVPEATSGQVQNPAGPKDAASKKRKEAPPPSTEDVDPVLWESLVRDGGIQKTTVPAMKLFLASVKLPVSGKKEVLIERLRKHFKL
jgi:hypothetical protein